MLGTENVQLVAVDGVGGYLFTAPEVGKNVAPRIKIGMDDDWAAVVGTLMHEAFEFAAIRMELCYRPTTDWSQDNGASTFVMTHTQFSEAIQRAGSFCTSALPVLAREWKKWNRKK